MKKDNVDVLKDELLSLGLYAEIFRADPPDQPADAINVWLDAHDRYPTDTVYAPIRGHEDDGWLWGPSFQYGRDADIDIPTLAKAIKETLQPRP